MAFETENTPGPADLSRRNSRMTEDEYRQLHEEKTGMTVADQRRAGLTPTPCECIAPNCPGWVMECSTCVSKAK